jgi:hypothetical protein
VHLVADLHEVVRWAEAQRVRWAFSDRNAGTRYTWFYKDLNRLDQINWDAVEARDFRHPLIKEGKQAEFLMHKAFPWSLVRWIGTYDRTMAERAMQVLHDASHQPLVSIEAEWYY